MISKRLKSITTFISKDDQVVDVGCDHGLLSIYLYENKLCKSIIASDINCNALSNAIENIKKRKLNIKTVISDGLSNIDTSYIDTVIISGMGTNTILHILEDKDKLKNIKKLIIQSNNDHKLLRTTLNEIGYYLQDEKIIYENKKYYITMYYIKSNKINTKLEYKYGIIKEENKDYYNYLINGNKEILKKIPLTKFKLRRKLRKEIKEIRGIIE